MKYKDTMEAIRKSGFLNYEYLFTPCIGLHRTAIKDLHITSIDADLLSSTSANYIIDNNNYILADDGTPYTSISKIKISHTLNDFKAKGFFMPYSSEWKEYSALDASPNDPLKLFSLSDFHSNIDTIQSLLKTKYGIGISTENAKFKSAEIAAEFILKAPLSEYSRAFHILKSLNTDRVTKIDSIKPDDGQNEWQSCIYKKSCYELYVYDKTRQLFEERKIALSENVIKIELRIPETYLYQTHLKGNLNEIEDADITSIFTRCYNRIIYNPYKRWHKTYLKNLNELVFEYRSKYKRWITELYKYVSDAEAHFQINLIDYQDIMLCPCIRTLDVRTQKRIEAQLATCFANTSYAQDTQSKISEVFKAVNECSTGISPVSLYSNYKI